LFKQVIRFALALALLSTGNSKAARIAMTAITTNSSISVNPVFVVMALLTQG
jgi:hypothetical protein